MASEDPVPEKKEAPAKAEVFKIHSMVRKIATRNQRMKAASHHRFVQRFGGGRITVRRARPATVTKALLLQYKNEIQKAVEEGKVVVKTTVGEIVDLNTFQVIPSATPTKPLPHPPLDSAKDDKTFEHGVGVKTELFEGGGVPGGEAPPLNVKPPLMSSDEKPIDTSGDPAKARAAASQGGEKSGGEPLGDDEPTQPDALNPEGDTNPGSKRGKDKKAEKSDKPKKDGPK